MKKNENEKRKGKRKRKNKNKNRKKRESPLLFWSSLIFTTNMTANFLAKNYTYSFLFAWLTIASLIFHSTHWPQSYSIFVKGLDKLTICAIVIYGGSIVWATFHTVQLFTQWRIVLLSIIVLTFYMTIHLYIYGYLTNQYCYSKDGNYWHYILHLISSVGHHAILLL